MPRQTSSSKAAYLELAEILDRAGFKVFFERGAPSGQFATPYHERDAPFVTVFAYPGRSIPGAALLEAYRRAERRLGARRRGERDGRMPVGVLIDNPPGRGVRQHIVALPMSEFLRLMRDAGRVAAL